jgi:hypothetical protein
MPHVVGSITNIAARGIGTHLAWVIETTWQDC